MKPPQHVPDRYVTTLGAVGTTRYARLWGWIVANNLGLSDWSTDEGVDAAWPRLERGMAQLQAWVNDPPQGDNVATREEIEDVMKGLRDVMRRGTKNRITTQGQARTASVEAKEEDYGGGDDWGW